MKAMNQGGGLKANTRTQIREFASILGTSNQSRITKVGHERLQS